MRVEATGQRDFRALWAATSVSHFGTMLGALSLTALLYLDASPAQMGLLAAATGVPVLLFALLAGVWVDRLPHRGVMVLADLGRCALLLSVPAAALAGSLRIEQLYVVAFGTGSLGVLFDLAYRSILPSLVPVEGLVVANSRLQMSESLAESVSPAAGGGIVQAAGGPVAVLVDALTFLASGLLILGIKARPVVRTATGESAWREALAGLRLILGQPVLRALFGMKATYSGFGGFFMALYSLWAIRELGLSPLAVGVLTGAGGAGSLVAAAWVGRLSQRFGLGRCIIASYALASVTIFAIPLAGGPPWLAFSILLIDQILGDGFWIIHNVGVNSLVQSMTPAAQLGRVNASNLLASLGPQPLGAVIAGLLATELGVQQALFVGAAGVSLGLVWMVLSPLRGIRSAEAAADSFNR